MKRYRLFDSVWSKLSGILVGHVQLGLNLWTLKTSCDWKGNLFRPSSTITSGYDQGCSPVNIFKIRSLNSNGVKNLFRAWTALVMNGRLNQVSQLKYPINIQFRALHSTLNIWVVNKSQKKSTIITSKRKRVNQAFQCWQNRMKTAPMSGRGTSLHPIIDS